MKENTEQKEMPKEPEKEQEKPEEKEKEKKEEPPKEDLGKTEMCQLIYYDFTVK